MTFCARNQLQNCTIIKMYLTKNSLSFSFFLFENHAHFKGIAWAACGVISSAESSVESSDW